MWIIGCEMMLAYTIYIYTSFITLHHYYTSISMISTCSTRHKAQPATSGERRKSWELLGTAHHFLRGGSWTSIENLLGGKRKNVDTVPNGKGGWDKDGDFSNRN
jgi:hypothetical protein